MSVTIFTRRNDDDDDGACNDCIHSGINFRLQMLSTLSGSVLRPVLFRLFDCLFICWLIRSLTFSFVNIRLPSAITNGRVLAALRAPGGGCALI